MGEQVKESSYRISEPLRERERQGERKRERERGERGKERECTLESDNKSYTWENLENFAHKGDRQSDGGDGGGGGRGRGGDRTWQVDKWMENGGGW